MRRNSAPFTMLCTWCGRTVVSMRARTLPEFTRFPDLPAGTAVIVCGKRCPERPAGAPVGSRIEPLVREVTSS
jgi:hypothetical protein